MPTIPPPIRLADLNNVLFCNKIIEPKADMKPPSNPLLDEMIFELIIARMESSRPMEPAKPRASDSYMLQFKSNTIPFDIIFTTEAYFA